MTVREGTRLESGAHTRNEVRGLTPHRSEGQEGRLMSPAQKKKPWRDERTEEARRFVLPCFPIRSIPIVDVTRELRSAIDR
ncbi:MAG: hypothetical protein JWP89_6373 [Schlesneria sp.]|nr:hypothetical protein [Schlesneria sp.]